MDLMLKGKVAVVGGASKGLGRACAQSLAEEGVSLAICSRSQADLETAAQEISTATGGDGPNGEKYLNMSVTLQVRDFSGNLSNTVQQAVKVYPNKQCGFSY